MSDVKNDFSQMETEEGHEWSTEDVQRLLNAIKENIPVVHQNSAYNQAQMRMDWSLVAFDPYSPEECKNKWKQISQKIRKVRTLPDLIDEAQDAIGSNNTKKYKILPGCPKRPMPPNSIFFKEKQASFKKKYPHLKLTELMKKVNKKYKALPPDEKEKYIKEFKRSSEEYDEKMNLFRKKCRKLQRKEKKSGLSKTSPENQPENQEATEPATEPTTPVKPPPNSYTLFCKEQWAARKDINNLNFIAVCAERWREMEKGTKEKYHQRFRQMKSEYQQSISAEGFRVKKKENSVKLAEMFPNEPKKPTQSGHVLFCREHMDLVKNKVSDISKQLSMVSPMWQALSSADRAQYRNMASDGFMKYTVDLKKWFEELSPEKKTAYRKHKPLNCEIIDLDIEVLRKGRPKRRATEKAENENLNIPSDSEDEVYSCSSDDKDNESIEDEDDEEEEEEDGMMFEA